MPALIPLLLIPGLLCDEALWRPQLNVLKTLADCRVQTTTAHDRIASSARAILASAPREFALAGLSMGGYVALEIMRQAPRRVMRLCLLDTSAHPNTDEQIRKRKLTLAMSKEGQFKGVTPRLMPTLIHPDHMKDQALIDTVTSMAERVGRDGFQNQQTANLYRIDSRPFLKNIKCPTQVIVGRQDEVTPLEVVKEMADAIPNARFDIIEDCGHLTTLEKPDEVNAIMKRWLTE